MVEESSWVLFSITYNEKSEEELEIPPNENCLRMGLGFFYSVYALAYFMF